MSRSRFIAGTLLAVGVQVDLTIGAVVRHVSAQTGVTVADIVGRQRLKPFVAARQEVMRIAHRTLNYPLGEVGKALGGRDHTTVRLGVLAAERRRA